MALYRRLPPGGFLDYGTDLLFPFVVTPVPSPFIGEFAALIAAEYPKVAPIIEVVPPSPIEEDIPLVFDPLEYYDDLIEIDQYNVPPFTHPSGVVIPGRWYALITNAEATKVDFEVFLGSLDDVEKPKFLEFLNLVLNEMTDPS